MADLSILRAILKPLRDRILLLVARGVVNLVDDAQQLQELQATFLADETRSKLERFQQYGFTAHAHPGAEALAMFIGGNRDHGIVFAVDDRRYRLKGLAQGEVALYDDLGKTVILRRGGDVEITAPRVLIVGDLHVTGDVSAAGEVADADGDMEEIRTVYNSHTHPGDSGGTTGTPIQPMT